MVVAVSVVHYAMSSTWVNVFLCVLAGFSPCRAIVQPPMILWRNDMEAIQRSERIEGLKPMVSCLQDIAQRWLSYSIGVSLLVPDFVEKPGLSKLFFTGLEEANVTIFTFSENFNEFKGFALGAVILIRDSSDFHLLTNLDDLCSSNCSFVVCLLNFHKDKASLLAEANDAVNAMWGMGIIKVVIIGSTEGKFFVVGTYSFQPDVDSVPEKPDILAECNELSTNKSTRIFHKLLMNNCRINVTSFDCPPYVHLVEKEGGLVFTGIEGDMFEAIASSLNITLNRMNTSAEGNLSIYDTIYHTLNRSSVSSSDVIFCELYFGEMENVEYSFSYEVQKVVWLVPPNPLVSLSGLVTPLQPVVWFAIIGLLLFTGIMKVLLFRKLSFLSVLGLILGVGLPRQPNTLSKRIQFLSWAFFGYVITQSYLASLAGQLTNTNVQTIETIEQLDNSGLPLGGVERYKELFKDDDTYVNIYDKYQTLTEEEYEQVLEDVESGKNTTMALVKEMKVSTVSHYPSPYDPHVLDETLAVYPVSLAAWERLPYMDQIDRKVHQLVENGLIKHWSRMYVNTSSSTNDVKVSNVLDIFHLSPSFLLLLIGHALSIITLFIEIGIHWRMNCSKNRNKPHRHLNKRNKVYKKYE